jgi:hypothetical protein
MPAFGQVDPNTLRIRQLPPPSRPLRLPRIHDQTNTDHRCDENQDHQGNTGRSTNTAARRNRVPLRVVSETARRLAAPRPHSRVETAPAAPRRTPSASTATYPADPESATPPSHWPASASSAPCRPAATGTRSACGPADAASAAPAKPPRPRARGGVAPGRSAPSVSPRVSAGERIRALSAAARVHLDARTRRRRQPELLSPPQHRHRSVPAAWVVGNVLVVSKSASTTRSRNASSGTRGAIATTRRSSSSGTLRDRHPTYHTAHGRPRPPWPTACVRSRRHGLVRRAGSGAPHLVWSGLGGPSIRPASRRSQQPRLRRCAVGRAT